MIQRCTARYRALERVGTEELAAGFEDENREPVEFESRAVTYYDDDFWVCHEDTNRTRLREALKDKKRKPNEIPAVDIERAGNGELLPRVRGD